MKYLPKFVAVALAVLLLLPSCGHAETSLVVGTKEAPPFSMQADDGSWEGISIGLWEYIARENGYGTMFRKMDVDGLLTGVASREFDASVAALTVTAERETMLDFSHPYFVSGLAIAVRQHDDGWHAMAGRFLSLPFLQVVGVLGLVLLVSGLLVWLVERRRNPEQFGGTALQGIGSGFWWAAVTMTTVGYGDKAPVTPAGRVIGLIWMFAGIIIISGFTAAITTTLTVGSLGVSINSLSDLHNVRTGTVHGSTSMEFLSDEKIPFREFQSIRDALQALDTRRIDAVVYDEPIMRYLVAGEEYGSLKVLEHSFRREYYAIALPAGSPMLEDVNRTLLQFIDSGEWRRLLFRYLKHSF
ncbi:transporter substrate-binding domain-containing protein [Prosthecochloris sp. N3]|uniref:Transporter substrate-binding domain-containing protein n=1 Tax=Prosthecochloris ethylica TaxID=2743976 RepID=A0ABR9XNN2_9CHLB|nr:transporter substrate-binding domain-containing protein [Prosthecochloris ethylica]MBF0585731.1 transporter substrate-binding domain-containing protein [Prosthecochloris ethylica]MBF0635641.1 transporter substrate-binding domain-containing protein [Prosthecochloris ethylica]NUK46940.1 transporter substrate-binding domain-containing protein [Prosthecochloris ethylica]